MTSVIFFRPLLHEHCLGKQSLQFIVLPPELVQLQDVRRQLRPRAEPAVDRLRTDAVLSGGLTRGDAIVANASENLLLDLRSDALVGHTSWGTKPV